MPIPKWFGGTTQPQEEDDVEIMTAAATAPAAATLPEADAGLLAACKAAGMETKEQFAARMGEMTADAAYKGKYEASLRDEAKRLAIIKGDTGLTALVDTFTIPQLEAYVATAGAEVDKKFQITPTQGAERQTDAARAEDALADAQAGSVALTPDQIKAQQDAGRKSYENRTGRRLPGNAR